MDNKNEELKYTNITIYDVALAADVSLATVSRVINNPEKVKEDTRNKVLLVINKLGYRPNAIAKGLASKKSTTVGVVVADLTRASMAEMLAGILDIAHRYGYTVKLFSIGEDMDLFDSLKGIVAERVDGVLYLNDELPEESILLVKKVFNGERIPFVLSNVSSHDPSIPSVSINYLQASYDITKKMINDERKNIYLLSTLRKYNVNDLKEEGYEKAIKEAGLESHIFRTSGDTNKNKNDFKEFFKDKSVDAVIGVRDSIAVSFLNVARLEKRRIPEDIAVAGFQNTRYAQLSRPTLTSIDIPVYEIGASAMKLLTKLMRNEEVDSTNIYLPHYIEIRESTK
jgi:LacI family transcriptional regulator